jgi:hypothetical protein
MMLLLHVVCKGSAIIHLLTMYKVENMPFVVEVVEAWDVGERASCRARQRG